MMHWVKQNILNAIVITSICVLPLTIDSLNPSAENERTINSEFNNYDATTYDNISYPGIKAPPPPENALGIDERSLWRLLADKKYDQLDKMIERFRGTYPDWQPPEDLIAAKIKGEIKEAMISEEPDRVIENSKNYPLAFTCEEIDHMWALGNALHKKGNTQALTNHYEKILINCDDSDHRLVTLQRASSQLPYTNTVDLIKLEMKKSHSAFEQDNLDNFHYGFFTGWFADAWDRKQMAEAEIPVMHLQKPVIDRKDAKMASLIGWWELQRKKPALARNWFGHAMDWQKVSNDPTQKSQRSDTAYGMALALRDSQQIDESKSIVKDWKDREPRMTKLFASPYVNIRSAIPRRTAAEIALERTIRKYNKGYYQGSLNTSQTALSKISDRGRVSKNQLKTTRSLQMFEAWSLYSLSQYREAADHFESLYLEKSDIDSARGVVLSAIENREYSKIRTLGATDCGPLCFLSSTRIPTDQPNVRSEVSDLYYLFYQSWIGEELKNKNYRSVELKILRIADRIIELEDCKMAAAAGWAYLEKPDPGSSLFWFERSMSWCPSVDNAYSLALVKHKMGDAEGAEKITSNWRKILTEEPGNISHDVHIINKLHSEILLERAVHEYELQNYTQSLSLAQESADLNPSIEADKLIAWNKYQLGDIQQAADAFEKLYRKHPDKQSADGLLTTLSALNKEDYFEELTKELGGPLNDHLADLHASQHYLEDQFVQAELIRKKLFPELKNIDTAAISFTPYARHRRGEEGLGQLDMVGMELAARAFAGQHHFSTSIDFMTLDSGTSAPNARLGSNANQLFNTFITTPTEDESLLIEPFFHYRYQNNLSPYFSVGSTPLGGEISGAFVGDLGVDWRQGDGKYNLELFAKNKQESILSISGLVDPVTGNKWGRVVEKGIQGNAQYQINDSWTLASGAKLSNLDGHSVADNDHFGTWAYLGYKLYPNGFKYLTVGPAYRFEHYDENRRFFTLGHGGYFSPDTFHRLGAEVNFQTDEGKQFIVKGRASLGYQRTTEDKAFAFPLSNTGPLFTGATNNGAAFDSQLSGVYRITPWLQLGAFLNFTQSPDFDDIGGGLMLRINAFDRPAVFSIDLPDQSWNY